MGYDGVPIRSIAIQLRLHQLLLCPMESQPLHNTIHRLAALVLLATYGINRSLQRADRAWRQRGQEPEYARVPPEVAIRPPVHLRQHL